MPVAPKPIAKCDHRIVGTAKTRRKNRRNVSLLTRTLDLVEIAASNRIMTARPSPKQQLGVTYNAGLGVPRTPPAGDVRCLHPTCTLVGADGTTVTSCRYRMDIWTVSLEQVKSAIVSSAAVFLMLSCSFYYSTTSV